ncbi:MAG TPA: hypothetical protein VFR54_13095 [Xanthobacteraceae bacterium]|nr:hypothetical protein [Xanthobacteraceae bacterium]
MARRPAQAQVQLWADAMAAFEWRRPAAHDCLERFDRYIARAFA